MFRLTRANGQHLMEQNYKSTAVRAMKDGTISSWPSNKCKFKAGDCALCAQITTIGGEKVRVTYRRAHGATVKKCAACDGHLCTRVLSGERDSCWKKWHTQKRLQRPNNGIAVKQRTVKR